MVKVSKLAVWDVDGVLYRELEAATKKTREIIIGELLVKHPVDDPENIAVWVAQRWEEIENQVKKAMAGS